MADVQQARHLGAQKGWFIVSGTRGNGMNGCALKSEEDMFPSNVVTTQEINENIDKCFLLSNPTKEEKGEFNIHKTVKPLSICEYIIKLTTFSEAAIVLDPFVGSGTTVVAAKRLGRKYIGIDTNQEYVEITLKRLDNIGHSKTTQEDKNVVRQLTLEDRGKSSKRKTMGIK